MSQLIPDSVIEVSCSSGQLSLNHLVSPALQLKLGQSYTFKLDASVIDFKFIDRTDAVKLIKSETFVIDAISLVDIVGYASQNMLGGSIRVVENDHLDFHRITSIADDRLISIDQVMGKLILFNPNRVLEIKINQPKNINVICSIDEFKIYQGCGALLTTTKDKCLSIDENQLILAMSDENMSLIKLSSQGDVILYDWPKLTQIKMCYLEPYCYLFSSTGLYKINISLVEPKLIEIACHTIKMPLSVITTPSSDIWIIYQETDQLIIDEWKDGKYDNILTASLTNDESQLSLIDFVPGAFWGNKYVFGERNGRINFLSSDNHGKWDIEHETSLMPELSHIAKAGLVVLTDGQIYHIYTSN
jgi:hypothetical protein